MKIKSLFLSFLALISIGVQSADDFNILDNTSITVSGGTIDNTPIGATTPSTGVFTSLTDTGLTSGRIPYVTTGGLFTDSANLTYNGSTLTTQAISGTTITATTAFSIGTGSTWSLVSTHPTMKAPSGKNFYIAANGSGSGTIGFTNTAMFANTTGTVDLGISGNAFKRIYFDYTNTAGGTTGNQTISKATGRVNFAAAATAITVTNTLVTANSNIMATAQTNDTTCSVKNVVPAAGSFVINMTAACTAETAVAFFVISTD